MKNTFFKSIILMAMAPFMAIGGCVNSNNNSSASKISFNNENDNLNYQLDLPKAGEEIAIINTNLGQIKLKFFEEVAPKAVENFKTHSKQGYYNGVIFHRVINNFMIQTGDPLGNGTGGESIWQKPFEDEFSDKVFNITGSVAMANCGKNTNGSQFFINQGGKEAFGGWDYYEAVYNKYRNNKNVPIIDMSKVTDKIRTLYNENGGNPHLDGYLNTLNKGHTVFAQVFEGMDVVNKIASLPTNNNDKPLDNIIIEKIDIITFEG